MNNNEDIQTMDVDVFELLLSQKIAVVKVKSGFLDEADYIARNLRDFDYKEIYRSAGRCPRSIVNISWKMSDYKWMILAKKQPVALFGVVSSVNKTGIPWMVATDEFNEYYIEKYFIEHCAEYIEQMFAFGDYQLLYNCVDIENKTSINWLKRCGAIFENPEPYGVFNLLFQKFSIPRSTH